MTTAAVLPVPAGGTVRESVTYTSACPGCGRDAAWTGHRTDRDNHAGPTLIVIDCHCTPDTPGESS